MNLKQMVFYPKDGKGEIRFSGGKSFQVPLTGVENTPIHQVTYLSNSPLISMTTDQGENVEVELPIFDSVTQRRGRPLVYLDQNAWSQIATALHQPERLTDSRIDDALWLADLAKEWKVILPFSLGTLGETTQWDNDVRRYQLGLTISQLSRGWQMLDPLEIRLAEMRGALRQYQEGIKVPLPQVWNLDANTLSITRSGELPTTNPSWEPEFSRIFDAVVALISLVDMLLIDSAIPREQSERWATKWNQISALLKKDKVTPADKEKIIRYNLLVDTRQELVKAAFEVGMEMENYSKWLKNFSGDAFKEMPAYGLFSEVMVLKLSNTEAKWKSNDLTDIFYMVQAAGYADAVVGERGFVALTRNAQKRLNRRENCFSSITKLRESNLLSSVSSQPPWN